MCAVAACGMRCYAITTREGSSGEIRRQGASLCAPAFWRAYLLQRTGPGRAIGWGFGSHYTFSSAEERSQREVGAWSVFTPLAEAVLLRCSPHSSGPEPESLQARLTFCAHSGQLLERSFAPLEFLEFTEPTDTLTVFLHGDRSVGLNPKLSSSKLRVPFRRQRLISSLL